MSFEEEPDGDTEEKGGKQKLDRARAQPLLQGRRARHRQRGRKADESRIADTHVTVNRVCDHPRDGGDAAGGESGLQ